MTKEKVIVAGKINIEGFKKVGKGALIGLSGYILTEIPVLFNMFDFGSYQPLAVVVLGVLINFLRKWLTSYKTK